MTIETLFRLFGVLVVDAVENNNDNTLVRHVGRLFCKESGRTPLWSEILLDNK